MRVLPAPQRDAMYEIYAFCRAVDDIAIGQGPASGATRRPRSLAGRISTGSMPASRRPGSVGSQPRPSASAWRGKIFSPSSTGWRWMSLRSPGAGFCRPRPLLRPRRQCRGRPIVQGLGLGEAEGRVSPMSSAAPYSSPISSATSTRMPHRRLYLPREALEDAGIAAREPAAVLADPALDRGLRRGRRPRPRAFRHRGAIIARCPRRATLAPRLMAKVYRHILERMTRQGWHAPRAAREDRPRASSLDASRRQILLMPRPVLHIVGAGLAGLAAAVRLTEDPPSRSSSMRRRITPAGAAAPITSRRWIR